MKDTTRQHRVDTQIEEIDACLDTANVKQSNFVLGLWGANGAGKSFLANFLCLSSTPGDGALNSKVIREQGPVRSSQGLDTVSKIPVLLEYGPRIRVTCYKTVGPSHDNEEMLEGAGTVVVDEPSVKTFESFEEAKVFMDSIDPLEVSALTYTGPFLHRSGFKLCDLPGITSELQQHIVDNSQLFAATNADGLFVFTKDRKFPPSSVASLGLLLNKMLEQRQLNRLPIVTVIYPHGYSESDCWLQNLDVCEDKDQLINERKEQALAGLRNAIEFVERDSDLYCPTLQGFLRARIFGELSRNCRSALFYTPEQERELRERGVSYDTHAKLLEAINHMKSRFIHSLLEPACHNKLKVENTYLHFLGDIKRCKNIQVKKQWAQEIIKFVKDHFQENADQLVTAWWEDENSPRETLLDHLASNSDEKPDSRRRTLREAVLELVPNLFEYVTARVRHSALRASFFMALLVTKPEIPMHDQLIEEKEDEFRVMLEQLGHSVEADRPKSGGVPKIQHGELFKEIGQMVEVMASEIEKELEGGFISFTKAVKREYPKVFPKVEEEPADEMVEKVRGFFCKRLDAFNKQLGASIIDKISELHDPWRDFCSQPSECVVDDNLIKLLKKKLASLSPRPSKVDNTGATEDTKLTLLQDGSRVLAETPRLFKHAFANVETASKQLRRNIESAKKRAFYLPEVQDRSNPGPFTLPELFSAIELLSSEEKSAFGYERVIRISFTNTEQPWLESASQFTIKAYANWKSDLEQLLSSTGNWIYPIMIPTKGRYKNKQAHLVFTPSLPASTTNAGDCPHLIYAFVEEQELDDYVASYDGASERLVFVSIPGKNRGVRFARSIIKHFQDHLRSSISRPFDYWWMIDDDVRQVRMYDTFGSATSMIPCDILLALLFAQKALTTAVDAVKPKLEVKSLIKDVSSLFLESGYLGIELAMHMNDLYTAAGSPVSALEYLRNGEWSSLMKGDSDEKEHHLQTFMQVLVEWRQTLLQNTNICQMAIANKKANEAIFRRHYNVEVAEGRGTAHYRVAIERCGTVLNYSPPLRLHSYTRWYELFVPQYEVDRRIIAEKAGNGSVNFFLNEDKLLTKRLTKDNLSGFQLFKFDIEYGDQKNGGCWDFRRKTPRSKRGQPQKRPWEKTAWIKRLDEDEIAGALIDKLYNKLPKQEHSKRMPFVKWYIQRHDDAEELTRQEKGQEHHFLQSAAEVFGVEIRFCKEKKGEKKKENKENEDEDEDEDQDEDEDEIKKEIEHEQVFNEQPTAPLIYITLLSP